MRRVLAFMMIVMLLLVMSVSTTFAAGKKNILKIGWIEAPQAGMNPFLLRNHGDYIFTCLMYEPLAIPLLDGTFRPWLARSWTYDADSKTWTFNLRENVTWSDGEPFTADDVKFTFDTAYETNVAIGSRTKAIVKSVEVADRYTVKFVLRDPMAAFVSAISATPIMPKHIWSKVGNVTQYQNPHPVSTGPFVYKEFKPRMFLHMVKNNKYWNGPVNIDEVLIRIYSNPQAMVVALKKGELGIIPSLTGSEKLIPVLKKDKNVEVIVGRSSHIQYIALNYRVDVFKNKRFRKAIDYAVDRRKIVESAAAGFAELPLMGYVAPMVTKWANPKVTWAGLNMTEQERLAKANAILDELGWKRGKDGIRVTKEGKKLEFSIRCYTNPVYIRSAEIIKSNLEKIGVKLNVMVSDPQTLYAGIIFSGKRPHDWEMLVHGSEMDPDPDHFAREYAPEPPNPWDNAPAFGWENEEIQSLLKKSRREMNEARRIEMIKKAQELFADELVVISLSHRYSSCAYRKDRYTGWKLEPVFYGTVLNPLGSLINVLSLKPID
ncbi:MAG: peptide ABC transporter substrate-binding protein [Deltaproteobacteria bacterium]|nr:peptide ABC transporter substrate-binding protein [Deltaproteobacteria bacterium]